MSASCSYVFSVNDSPYSPENTLRIDIEKDKYSDEKILIRLIFTEKTKNKNDMLCNFYNIKTDFDFNPENIEILFDYFLDIK